MRLGSHRSSATSGKRSTDAVGGKQFNGGRCACANAHDALRQRPDAGFVTWRSRYSSGSRTASELAASMTQ
jgi:hypothetical protein